MLSKLYYALARNIWFKVDATIWQVPIRISPPHVWNGILHSLGQRVGIFRKRVHDAYSPHRWGFHILGFEIGSRGNKPPAIPGKVYLFVREVVERLTGEKEWE